MNETQPTIHASVTERSSYEIIRGLSTRPDPVTMVSGRKINVAQLFLERADAAVSSSSFSFLSLGEGNSSLISGMIEERRHRIKILANEPDGLKGQIPNSDHIVAVDIEYPAHDKDGSITDRRRPDNGDASGIDHYQTSSVFLIQKYPKNYISELFQNLDLRDETGQRRKFKTIFSNASLGTVISDGSVQEASDIIDRIVEHLDLEGVVIIHSAPFGDLSRNIEKRPAYLNKLKELKRAGAISDYNLDWMNSAIRETQRVPVVLILLGPKFKN